MGIINTWGIGDADNNYRLFIDLTCIDKKYLTAPRKQRHYDVIKTGSCKRPRVHNVNGNRKKKQKKAQRQFVLNSRIRLRRQKDIK